MDNEARILGLPRHKDCTSHCHGLLPCDRDVHRDVNGVWDIGKFVSETLSSISSMMSLMPKLWGSIMAVMHRNMVAVKHSNDLVVMCCITMLYYTFF